MPVEQSDNLLKVVERNIRLRAKALGITLSDLSKQIEMTEAGFYKMLSSESIKLKTLKKVAEVLQMPLGAFLNTKAPSSDYQQTDSSFTLAEPAAEYSSETEVLKKQIKQLKSQLKDKERIIALMSKQV